MVRALEYSTGLPAARQVDGNQRYDQPAAQLNERDRASLAMHNALTVRSLVLCAVACEDGAEVLIENPPSARPSPRGLGSTAYWAPRAGGFHLG